MSRARAAGVFCPFARLAIRSGRSMYFSVIRASTSEITMIAVPETNVVSFSLS